VEDSKHNSIQSKHVFDDRMKSNFKIIKAAMW